MVQFTGVKRKIWECRTIGMEKEALDMVWM